VEKRRTAVQHLTVLLRKSVRCLFLLSGNETESGVDCTITSVGARFEL
jgi:hypothetical protein